MTGRTTRGGHYYDLAAGGAVLVALFIVLGVGAAMATAVIFVLRMEVERGAGEGATHQPDLFGFELEDVMYLVGPITWLGLVQPFLVLAGIDAPLFALFVLLQGRSLMVEGKT